MKRLKCFAVTPEKYDTYVFSNPASDAGAIRIGPTGGVISLLPVAPRPGAMPEYPVGEGYRVKLPVHVVPGASAWLLAQFDIVLVEDPTQDPREVTNVRARLHDGTDEYVWAAGAWAVVVDEDADWNDLADLVEGLSDWPADSSIGLVFELSTTSAYFTPTLRSYLLMYEVDLPSEFNDWLYGALVTAMSEEIRPEKDIQVESDGTVNIDFSEVEDAVEDGWEFDEVVSAFNLTDDPYRKVDLLTSFDSGSRAIVLSSAPVAGDVVLLRATYAPVVAVTTDQDYVELGCVPTITFERVNVVDRGESPEDHYIVNEYVSPPTATIWPAPRLSNIEIDLAVTSSLSTDAFRLAGEVTKWLNDRLLLTSPTTGDQVTMRIIRPLEPLSAPDRSGVRTLAMSFSLEDMYFQHRDPVQSGDGSAGSAFAYGVTRVQVTTTVGSTSVVTNVS